jgi:hypothetical protein
MVSSSSASSSYSNCCPTSMVVLLSSSRKAEWSGLMTKLLYSRVVWSWWLVRSFSSLSWTLIFYRKMMTSRDVRQ